MKYSSAVQHPRRRLRLTASALVLWQLTAVALGPVVVHSSTDLAAVGTQPGTAECPVCEHQLTPGAACPMHSESADKATNGGACALTSGDNPFSKLFTVMGSAGVPVPQIDTSEPMSADRVFVSSAIFLSDFSPIPSVPPPRA